MRGVARAGYEDLDFNESSSAVSSPVLRQAIMMALDRETMAADVLAPYGVTAAPSKTGSTFPVRSRLRSRRHGYDKPAPAAALTVLASNGYTFSDGTLYRPGWQARGSLAVRAPPIPWRNNSAP